MQTLLIDHILVQVQVFTTISTITVSYLLPNFSRLLPCTPNGVPIASFLFHFRPRGLNIFYQLFLLTTLAFIYTYFITVRRLLLYFTIYNERRPGPLIDALLSRGKKSTIKNIRDKSTTSFISSSSIS